MIIEADGVSRSIGVPDECSETTSMEGCEELVELVDNFLLRTTGLPSTTDASHSMWNWVEEPLETEVTLSFLRCPR